MSARAPVQFTQADISRAIKGAIKGARAAGMGLARVEFDPSTGKVIVVAGKPEAAPASGLNDWDGA
jgi:hypothetical protein